MRSVIRYTFDRCRARDAEPSPCAWFDCIGWVYSGGRLRGSLYTACTTRLNVPARDEMPGIQPGSACELVLARRTRPGRGLLYFIRERDGDDQHNTRIVLLLQRLCLSGKEEFDFSDELRRLLEKLRTESAWLECDMTPRAYASSDDEDLAGSG